MFLFDESTTRERGKQWFDEAYRVIDTRLKEIRFSLVGHGQWTDRSQWNLSIFEGRIGFVPEARLRRYRRGFHRIVQIEYAQTMQLPDSDEDERVEGISNRLRIDSEWVE